MTANGGRVFSGGENVPDYRTLCSLPSAAAALKTTELHFKANRVVRGLRQLQVRWGNQRPLTTKGHGQGGRGNRRSKLKQSDGTPKQDPTVFTRNKGTSKSGKRRDGPRLRQATRACSGCLRPHRGSQQGAVGRGRPREAVTALNVGTWQLRKAEVREPHPRTARGAGRSAAGTGAFGHPPGRSPVSSLPATSLRSGLCHKARSKGILRGRDDLPLPGDGLCVEVPRGPQQRQHSESPVACPPTWAQWALEKGVFKKHIYSSIKCVKYVELHLTKL